MNLQSILQSFLNFFWVHLCRPFTKMCFLNGLEPVKYSNIFNLEYFVFVLSLIQLAGNIFFKCIFFVGQDQVASEVIVESGRS